MLRAGARSLFRSLSQMRGRAMATDAPITRSVETVHAPAPPPLPNHRSILALDGDAIRPFVQPNAYVAPSASVIGSVVVNDMAAVMYGAVLRGDLGLIHIGVYTVVGDNATLTTSAVEGEISPIDAVNHGLTLKPDLFIGDYVSIGPNATLSSCHVDGRSIIGAGSTINPGVKIGRGSVVLPNSTVVPDTEIPPAEVWGGSPAQKIRSLYPDEIVDIEKNATAAYRATYSHAYEFLPVGFAYLEREKVTRSKAELVD